jgi:hypothetical protein
MIIFLLAAGYGGHCVQDALCRKLAQGSNTIGSRRAACEWRVAAALRPSTRCGTTAQVRRRLAERLGGHAARAAALVRISSLYVHHTKVTLITHRLYF